MQKMNRIHFWWNLNCTSAGCILMDKNKNEFTINLHILSTAINIQLFHTQAMWSNKHAKHMGCVLFRNIIDDRIANFAIAWEM